VKDVRHGIVLVEVDHPGWIQMIQLKRREICRTLQRTYPALGIDDLRCILQVEEPDQRHIPEPMPEKKRELPREKQPNGDEERESFQRLMERLSESISRRDKDLES
jgi:hypothetical protein